MLFVQFRFVVFFLIVFGVHWALRTNTARKTWLLIASHFFYACLFLGGPDSASANEFPPVTFFKAIAAGQPLPVGWWFPFVLWGSTIMDYVVGLRIGDASNEWKRRMWLLVSLMVNLGVLGFFKYFNFFIDSVHATLDWFGLHTSKGTLQIFLPYGISFYTFQSMSYSIDVYRRRLEPVRKFLDLAFFISFFPQLVAGPIVRAMTFLPQVVEKRVWARVDVRACLTLFFIGFVKKACISENVAPVVDAFFNDPGKYDVMSTWIAVLFYAVQIYCDFSGYSDMAIASSRLLGYELTLNFDFPYFSKNITEFWRKWHISLSTWLRDYLYIPLGGSRGTKAFTYRNLMLTMVLGGLWHGASWTFVIWGAMHGLALIVHREYTRFADNAGVWWQRLRPFVGTVFCFYWICITWIFFRAQDVVHPKTGQIKSSGFEVARTTLKSFVLFDQNGSKSFSNSCLWFFAGLVAVHWLASRQYLARWWRRIPDWLYAALLGVGLAVAFAFVPQQFKAFIYFQF
ncbi:MAG TPA: MBOAT family O-acyltransferase [Chthoniobacteraceae bacterium]|jgi:alginate O-acetyltransferase complex protein AlgI|nr:MBOAT family O-acyltransferase [Chthoniobacteraceae bacterium]